MRHNNPGETDGEVTAGKPWRCRAPPAAEKNTLPGPRRK